jgi:hypothetical protein
MASPMVPARGGPGQGFFCEDIQRKYCMSQALAWCVCAVGVHPDRFSDRLCVTFLHGGADVVFAGSAAPDRVPSRFMYPARRVCISPHPHSPLAARVRQEVLVFAVPVQAPTALPQAQETVCADSNVRTPVDTLLARPSPPLLSAPLARMHIVFLARRWSHWAPVCASAFEYVYVRACLWGRGACL